MVGDSRTRGRASLTARGVSAQAKGLELRFASEAHEIELRSPFLPKFGPQCRNQHYQNSDPSTFPPLSPIKTRGAERSDHDLPYRTVLRVRETRDPPSFDGAMESQDGLVATHFRISKAGFGLGVSLGAYDILLIVAEDKEPSVYRRV
jgi:hypothetical protein